MTISKVEQLKSTADQWVTLAFKSYSDLFLGQALIIDLASAGKKGDNITLKVTYATNKEAIAINWLTKDQTATHTLAYLFTQCEPIHCRSVAPFQDTPSLKSPYTANVTVPAPYVAKMSALEYSPVTVKDKITYRFY